MNASLSTDFVISYTPSVFTELNMMLVRLSGATSPQDSKCSDLLAQWMSSSPLIRALFTEAMDHAPLPAVHKTKVQAIRTYAEALFPAPHLIGLLLELGAPRSSFWVLSEYITRRGDAYTARTGPPFPQPNTTQDQFDATWKSLTTPLALSPRWNVPTPHRRVAVGPCGRGHNICNPGRHCACLLTGPAPSPLWCGVTGILAPVAVGRSYPWGSGGGGAFLRNVKSRGFA